MGIRPNYALIDLNALQNNIQAVRTTLKEGVKLIAVIKANAYGHGIIEMAQAMQQYGVDSFAVAIPEEGERLRQAGVTQPILVLGALLPESAELVIRNDLIPTVCSSEVLQALQRFASQQGKICSIHIKVDTGMNRIGIRSTQELVELLERVKVCGNITLEGLYTHFAVSESEDTSFTMLQAKRFEEFVQTTRQHGFDPMLHVSNSGAILNFPELQYDLVRAGIVLYGCLPGSECAGKLQLEPVLTWKTHVVHVKDIQPGDTVSYGRTYTAETPRRIATLPVGYGDGYKRCLSNKAQVLIHGCRATVIGTICMDQLLIDVTDLDAVRPGDEVVLLGRQGDHCITAEEMAGWAGTICYEVLLSISERVPRVYLPSRAKKG